MPWQLSWGWRLNHCRSDRWKFDRCDSVAARGQKPTFNRHKEILRCPYSARVLLQTKGHYLQQALRLGALLPSRFWSFQRQSWVCQKHGSRSNQRVHPSDLWTATKTQSAEHDNTTNLRASSTGTAGQRPEQLIVRSYCTWCFNIPKSDFKRNHQWIGKWNAYLTHLIFLDQN